MIYEVLVLENMRKPTKKNCDKNEEKNKFVLSKKFFNLPGRHDVSILNSQPAKIVEGAEFM